ncbi:MAG: hypothetical protein U9N63_08430, partial [Pseudomonadota bacterium]|nr:hypothetical protein [Pseudomonadota bacterium]
MTNQRTTLSLLLFIVFTLLLCSSCSRIPFMPRLEIDSFPESNDAIETMKVRGVVYTRAINPQAALDPLAPPAIWVPSQVYQSGKYLAYTADLPKTATETESADGNLTGETAGVADMQTADSSDFNKEESAEEQLTETAPVIPPLRR